MAMFTSLLASVQVLTFEWTAALFARGETGWRFDLPSALIGFVLGVLCAGAVYLMRGRITAAREAVQSRAEHVQERLSTGVEDRYREQVIEQAEHDHLLRRYATLSELYVPRRLAVPHALPFPPHALEDEQEGARWQDLRLHDALHPAPVTIDLSEAVRQHNKLAFLGPMGSGRTTLIAYLTQLYARRVAWRLTLPEPQEEDEPELVAARERERERLPVRVALQHVDLSSADQGGRHALIAPIADYLTSSLQGLIAMPAASMIRSRIVEGSCVLFLDNLDMLDAGARQAALRWIGQLVRAYPGNVFVVAGQVERYAALRDIGFATLHLDGLDRREVLRFAGRWRRMREDFELAQWEAEVAAAQADLQRETIRARREGRPLPAEEDYAGPTAPEPAPHLLDVWPAGRRERVLPLDLALAALLWREGDTAPQEPSLRYAQAALTAFGRAGDGLLAPPQWAHVLASVAWTMQVEGRYHAAREAFEQAVTHLLDELYATSTDLRHLTEEEEKEKPDFGRQGRSAVEALLRTADLLTEGEGGRGRVAFTHPIYRAYLAAQHAAHVDGSATLIEHIRDPQWQDTILFYSTLANVAPLVVARLKGPDDLFRSSFFAAAAYLAASPQADARLQGGVLAELAQLFVDPTQPAVLCSSAAAAIAHSKGKGVIYLFGQAMAHKDPLVRRIGVWGLSQMDHERVLAGLQRALVDPHRLVRIEALHGLAGIGGEPAIEGLLQGLQDEEELTRRVAAELLATVGAEGHDLLRQTTQTDDMYIRRAAVFGLGAVGEGWAIDIVDQMRREDDEWFVRSAATEVMERVTSPPPPIAPRPAWADAQEWLAEWASRRGLALGTADQVQSATLQALQEGDWAARTAAADVLHVSGDAAAIPVLTAALGDENMLAREAAFAALHAIGARTGSHVPRPAPAKE